jgi:hypothetical protein
VGQRAPQVELKNWPWREADGQEPNGPKFPNFAEQEAVRRGYGEITLYTHEKMSENPAMYPALGWVETERREQNGYQRVFFHKSLGD